MDFFLTLLLILKVRIMAKIDKLKQKQTEKLKERCRNKISLKGKCSQILSQTDYEGGKIEFLIEFDENCVFYGISYGAKYYLPKGTCGENLIDELELKWQPIRKKITEILNLPLRMSDILGEENGQIVYWPFFVSLGEEQDMDIAEINLLAMKEAFEKIISDKFKFNINIIK